MARLWRTMADARARAMLVAVAGSIVVMQVARVRVQVAEQWDLMGHLGVGLVWRVAGGERVRPRAAAAGVRK